MTYDEMLQAHVRDFDRVAARVRAIMLEKNYDNDESAEMKSLRGELQDTVHRAFRLKVCHGRSETLLAMERNNLAKAEGRLP